MFKCIMFMVLLRELSFKPSVRVRQAHIFALRFSDISWKELIWCKHCNFCPISLFLSFQKHYHEFSNNSLVLKCSLVNVNDLTLSKQRELLTVTRQLKPYLVDVTKIAAVGVDFFPRVGQSFHDANSSCWWQWQWLWQWWRQCWPGSQIATWQSWWL